MFIFNLKGWPWHRLVRQAKSDTRYRPTMLGHVLESEKDFTCQLQLTWIEPMVVINNHLG